MSKQFCETTPSKRASQATQAETKFAELNVHFQQQLSSCCGMPGCPVEAMHKIIKAAAPTIDGKMIHDYARRIEHAKALVDHFMVDEFDVGGAPPLPRSLPFAVVSAVITDGIGNLAVGMNDFSSEKS